MKRGEIYLVDLGVGAGREVSGLRPVVVVSNDVSNVHPVLVIVVPTIEVSDVRIALGFLLPSAESGCATDLVVISRHPRALDPGRFPSAPCGVVPPDLLDKISSILKGELDLWR